MELSEKPIFISEDEKWVITIKEEGEIETIDFRKGEKFGYVFHHGDDKKEIKESSVFKKVIEDIEKWEEVLRKQLHLQNVKLLNKEENMYLFYVELDTFFAKQYYKLEENEGKMYAQLHKETEQFLLPLEKKIIRGKLKLCLSDEYKMTRIYVPKNIKVEEADLTLSETKSYGYYKCQFLTHRSFLQDLADKINEHPAVRVKMLVM